MYIVLASVYVIELTWLLDTYLSEQQEEGEYIQEENDPFYFAE